MVARRSLLRSLGVAAVLVALAGAVIAAVAVERASAVTAASGWKVTLVGEAAAHDTPRLNGDYVVYRGASQDAVYLYQISTGTTTKINTTAKMVHEVCKDGRYVAWVSNGVWVYDIVTGGPAQQVGLTAGVDLCLSWGRLVWRGPSTQQTGMWDIYIHNIPLNAGRTLGRGAEGIAELSLDRDYLVWQEIIAKDREIMLHDFTVDQSVNITATRGAGLADTDPHVAANGNVVWVGQDGSDTEIFLYDHASRVTRQLTNDSRKHQDPLTDGRWVTWSQGGDLWLADANASDPAAGAHLIVGTGDGSSGVNGKALGGGWLAYCGGYSIWLYNTAAGTSSIVSNDAFEGCWNLQTNGQRIVAMVGSTAVRLFEKASGTTTTTTATTTTTSSTTTTSLPGITLPGGNTFWDVPANHPYYDAIEGIADAGVIDGYDDGSFRPGNLVTRQQFAKMIVGTLGFPCSELDICYFSDVVNGGSSTLYPDNYVAVAAAYSITTGIGGGKYGPYRDITRAQVITMVVRAAQGYTNGLKTPDAAYYSGWGLFRGFNDPTHGYNAQLAEFNGLLTGLQGSGDIATWMWQPATRGEVAQILWNLSNTPGLAG